MFRPPVISFIRDDVTITERTSTPFALLLNPEAIPDGTPVRLTSSSSDVVISPEEYSVDHTESKDGVITKITHLIGRRAGIQTLVTAEVPQGRTTAKVVVIPETMCYPPNGLLFDPESLKLRQGSTRAIDLYVDCEKVKTGSVIQFDIDNSVFTSSGSRVVLSEAHRITKDIARIRMRVSGVGNIGSQGTLVVRVAPFETKASLVIVSKKESTQLPERGGRFKQPSFEHLADKVTTYISSDGTVIINLNDEVNKRYFGTEPEAACENELHCQVRLAELVLDECLTEIISKAWGKTLDRRFPNDPVTDIHRYVLEHKYEYGPAFHNAFVTLQETAPNSTKKEVCNDSKASVVSLTTQTG